MKKSKIFLKDYIEEKEENVDKGNEEKIFSKIK